MVGGDVVVLNGDGDVVRGDDVVVNGGGVVEAFMHSMSHPK